MQRLPRKEILPHNWFILFLFTHLIGWTLIPALVRLNLPLDAIEGAMWGQQLEWGYDKNPFLNGWLTALALNISHHADSAIYFFSQLSVVICFICVWKLAKEILPKKYALIAVFLLEGIQYYNFHAIDFNDNTLELSLWALTTYFFYLALRSSSSLHWMLTGLFAGIGMMAKYYTGLLLLAMFIFMLAEPRNREQFLKYPPYLGLVIFISVITPHLVWLYFHDMVTIHYMFARTSSLPDWINHFFYPSEFAWQQLQALLPALILSGFFFLRRGKSPWQIKQFDKLFLIYVGIGPFLLTLLLSFMIGIKLRAGWGLPLMSLWGIIIIAALKPDLSKKTFHSFIFTTFILLFIFLFGYRYSLLSPNTSTAVFPGKEIALTINQSWRETFHSPLSYVAGSRWIGGNIAHYANDHPSVFVNWKLYQAPWINLQELKHKGAAFVWEVTEGETLPVQIREQFPQLLPEKNITFARLRHGKKVDTVTVGVAFLPPHS